MIGPEILARTMSVSTRRGKSGRAWQYHSRSDAHSKVACWTLLLDALLECDVLRRDAEDGKLGFALNYLMSGQMNKTLDMVLTRVQPSRKKVRRRHFVDLVNKYNIQLSSSDALALSALPGIEAEHRDDVSEVVLALEAKACMTEHSKSLPRLHAEILATGFLAKQCMPKCITVSYTLVNTADRFRTPSNAGVKVNEHTQPKDAAHVFEMIERAIPLSRNPRFKELGYEVCGVLPISCQNDGTPVSVATGSHAPSRSSHIRYERMVISLCSEYRALVR